MPNDLADSSTTDPLHDLGSGDFDRVVAPHRRELQAHCYRMLGSWTDAEDALQEVLLRAWRGLDRFEGRSSLRSWLYQIATNTCLTALGRRARRTVPELAQPPAAAGASLAPPEEQAHWVQPMPTGGGDVEAIVANRESVRLAFIVALQNLPPRQRATLLLRDVVGCAAREVADMLETTPASVNSALARARERMERFQEEHGDEPPVDPLDREQERLLDDYLGAWEAGDVATLASLLADDAVFSMPPYPTWYRGRAAIAGALTGVVFAGARAFRLRPTSANGLPAFVFYRRGEPGPGLKGAKRTRTTFTGTGVQVVFPAAGRMAKVITFLDPRLVAAFGFPGEVREG